MTKQNKQKPNKTKETLQMVFQAIFSIDLPLGQFLSKEGTLLIALHFLRKKKIPICKSSILVPAKENGNLGRKHREIPTKTIQCNAVWHLFFKNLRLKVHFISKSSQ